MWRLTQLVQGWEIYAIDSGQTHLLIAIKANKSLAMLGQRLKGTYFAFKGNRQFARSLDGAVVPVQEFGRLDALNQ